jgi:hypothetical protein
VKPEPATPSHSTPRTCSRNGIVIGEPGAPSPRAAGFASSSRRASPTTAVSPSASQRRSGRRWSLRMTS